MALSADQICSKIPGLTYKQRMLCAAKPDAMVAISNGAKLGLAECQEQFRYHRWNCTAIGSRNGFGHVVVVGMFLAFDSLFKRDASKTANIPKSKFKETLVVVCATISIGNEQNENPLSLWSGNGGKKNECS